MRTRDILLAALLVLVFLAPLTVLFLYALSGTWRYPALTPQTYSLRGVLFLTRNGTAILRSLLSSVAYSVLTVVVSFAVCVLPASLLARYEFRGRIALESVFLSPVLVPAITFAVGIHYTFIVLRLADTYVGVILVLTFFASPYMLRALTVGFQTYSEDVDRCARNLGASLWRRLLRVHLPLLAPAVISGGTVVFLVAFSEYFLVFLIGGGAVRSFTGYLFPFLSSSDSAIGSILTLVFLVAPLLLFLVIDLTVIRTQRKKGVLG